MDTIAAISTALAPAGIGIIRISGETAWNVAQLFFISKNNRQIKEMKPYTAAYGTVFHQGKNGSGKRIIDDGIVTVFKAPHSYTGEDVVEVSCHGGVFVLKEVLEEALRNGARLAEPGEFTKRAFLNGKLDLTRAEAVMDLIRSNSEAGARAAALQHEGKLYRELKEIKNGLLSVSAAITAWIDFPEEDVPSVERSTLGESLEPALDRISRYIDQYKQGKIIQEGINASIIGKPNSGKSTLMNRLSGFDKSIVTEIPGTTRDIIEEHIRLGDLVLNISDTAGLHHTDDPVEKIGVQRTRERAENSQLILAVFDSSTKIDGDDEEIIRLASRGNAIAVLNKIDLPVSLDTDKIKKKFAVVVGISAKQGTGIPELTDAVLKMAGLQKFDFSAGWIANRRQLECAKEAQEALRRACTAVEKGITLDAVSVDIEDAIRAICSWTGENATESIIDEVFSKFCVGK